MDVIEKYLEILENNGDYSANTLRSYTADLRRFANFLNSELNGDLIEGVTPLGDLFTKFLDYEELQGFKPSTIHRRKVALTQFGGYLFEKGVIDQSAVEKISAYKKDVWRKIAHRDLMLLSDDECVRLEKTLLNEKSSRVYRDISIITLMLETGLSINSIIGLNLSDLDFRAERLRADNGFQTIRYSIPKSSEYLTEYLKSSRRELTQSTTEQALFVSQMGGRITRQGVWQVLRGWGELANISVTLSPRVIRHTAVFKMMKLNMSVEEIQKLLGHSNIMSTKALIRKVSKQTNTTKRR